MDEHPARTAADPVLADELVRLGVDLQQFVAVEGRDPDPVPGLRDEARAPVDRDLGQDPGVRFRARRRGEGGRGGRRGTRRSRRRRTRPRATTPRRGQGPATTGVRPSHPLHAPCTSPGSGGPCRTEGYARRVSLYRLREPAPMLSEPVMIAAFDGWIDAAGAATACANHIAGEGADRVLRRGLAERLSRAPSRPGRRGRRPGPDAVAGHRPPARGGRRAGPPRPGRPGARLQVEAAGGRRP